MDFSTDYLAWDNVEAVTLLVATRAAPRLVLVPVAKRRAVRGSQKSPSGGVYAGFEVRWLVPRGVLTAGVEPKLADVVEDAKGTQWTVLTVERLKADQTLALGCVDLVLALDLRDVVTLQRAVVSYDPAGVPGKDDWQALYAGVPARVQPVRQDVEDARGGRVARRRYEVTLGVQVLDLDVSQDRLAWNDGGTLRLLDLVELRHSEEIDFLPVIDAEERL